MLDIRAQIASELDLNQSLASEGLELLRDAATQAALARRGDMRCCAA